MDGSTGMCSCKDTRANYIDSATFASTSICECTDPNAYIDPSGQCQCKDEWATINAADGLCLCNDPNSMILTTGKVGYCGCKDTNHAVINHATGLCQCKDFDNA